MGSSSISTISAASIAASEPIAPIAIPISDRLSTGASFIPSPTNASFSLSFLLLSISSTLSTLSAGSNSLYTVSIPSSIAVCSAGVFASPVSITVFRIPMLFSLFIASFECGLTLSEITICPAYFPPIAIWIIVPTLWQLMYSMPRRVISLSFPTATSIPSILAVTPFPLISSISVTRLLSGSFP